MQAVRKKVIAWKMEKEKNEKAGSKRKKSYTSKKSSKQSRKPPGDEDDKDCKDEENKSSSEGGDAGNDTRNTTSDLQKTSEGTNYHNECCILRETTRRMKHSHTLELGPRGVSIGPRQQDVQSKCCGDKVLLPCRVLPCSD
ncbi:Hepatoma-derived growth factor-related protein 3 [Plecturocebus cupreus]